MAKRNLTLQLDDEVIRRAKVIAAQRDTSVSKLVADQLADLVADDLNYERAHHRYRELLATVRGSSGGVHVSRDELHDRSSLREGRA